MPSRRHRTTEPEAIHLSVARQRRRRTVVVAVVALCAVVAVLAWAGAGLVEPVSGAAGIGAAQVGPLGSEDGYVPPGQSLSPSGSMPAIARLRPQLRAAVRRAAIDARTDGVAVRIASGWRSARYQRELMRRAIKLYGSVRVARQFVLPPDRSSHVRGAAVDVAPLAAALWLSQHGNAYGLCQIYANERWHFELAVVPGQACPAPRTDATAG